MTYIIRYPEHPPTPPPLHRNKIGPRQPGITLKTPTYLEHRRAREAHVPLHRQAVAPDEAGSSRSHSGVQLLHKLELLGVQRHHGGNAVPTVRAKRTHDKKKEKKTGNMVGKKICNISNGWNIATTRSKHTHTRLGLKSYAAVVPTVYFSRALALWSTLLHGPRYTLKKTKILSKQHTPSLESVPQNIDSTITKRQVITQTIAAKRGFVSLPPPPPIPPRRVRCYQLPIKDTVHIHHLKKKKKRAKNQWHRQHEKKTHTHWKHLMAIPKQHTHPNITQQGRLLYQE